MRMRAHRLTMHSTPARPDEFPAENLIPMSTDRVTKTETDLLQLTSPETVLESLTPALLAVNTARKVSSLNPQAERLLSAAGGSTVLGGLESFPEALRQAVEQSFQTSEAMPERLIELPRPSGAARRVRLSTLPLGASDGSTTGVLVVLTDLTASEELQKQMHHLDCLASIGTLSASMAHEIKNALVAVKTFVDLLVRKNKGADLADIVGREIHRIDSIVSQMLKFAGPAKPTFSSLHLHGLLEHCLRVVEHQLGAKQVRLKKSLAASSDRVRGDSYPLEQVFLNLFLNAMDAMRPGGELSITTDLVAEPDASSAAPPEALLRVRIQDNGVGIPPENIPRLFDPFFTTKSDGTGLGLSITRRIIQEHNGSINVESGPGSGTTFTLLLPCAPRKA